MSRIENPEDMKNYVDQVATHRHWKLNPDKDFTDPILSGLLANAQKLTRPFCPCRDTNGDLAKDRDIVCPCAYAQPDIEEFGQCYCGLFLSLQKRPEEVSSIPERRQED